MAQQDFVLDGSLDAVPYGAELEASFQALATSNSGTVFPTVTYPFQQVVRTDLSMAYQRAPGSVTWLPMYTPGQSLVRPSLNDFRLTVTSGVPYGATGANIATLYWTQATGNQVSLWDASATAWKQHTLTEQTISLSGRASGIVYDIFVFATAQNTVSFEILAWTSFSARATSLARQDGVWVKSGAPERKYIGSFVTTGTGQTQMDSLILGLYNADNKRNRAASRNLPDFTPAATANQTWTALPVESRLFVLVGLPGDELTASAQFLGSVVVATSAGAAADCRFAFSLGSSTAIDGRSTVAYHGTSSSPTNTYQGLGFIQSTCRLQIPSMAIGYTDVRILQASVNVATAPVVPNFFGSGFNSGLTALQVASLG